MYDVNPEIAFIAIALKVWGFSFKTYLYLGLRNGSSYTGG